MLRSTVLMGYLSFVLFMIAHGLNMWLPYIFTALVGSAADSSAPLPQAGRAPTLCEMLQRSQQSVSPVSSGSANASAATADEAACTATAASPIVYQLLLAYTGSCVLIFYAATLLMRHCDLRRILVVWFAVSAMAATAFVWLPAAGDGRSLTVVVLVAVLFLSCGNCGCIVGAVAQDLFPTRVRAMALCAIFALGRLGSVLGSWTLGAALMGAGDDGGVVRCEAVFWLSAAALVSCAVLVGGCLPRTSAET